MNLHLTSPLVATSYLTLHNVTLSSDVTERNVSFSYSLNKTHSTLSTSTHPRKWLSQAQHHAQLSVNLTQPHLKFRREKFAVSEDIIFFFIK